MRYTKLLNLLIVCICFIPSLVYGLVLPDKDTNLNLYVGEYRSVITPDDVTPVPIPIASIDIDPIVIQYLQVQGIDISRLTIQQMRLVKIGIDVIGIYAISVFTFDEVIELGKYLRDAVKSVRISYYIKNRDYVNLRAELAGVIPPDKIQALINYESGNRKATLVPIEWALWRGEYEINDVIPDGDVFLLVNDLNTGFEKLYDDYFNIHKGKTMVVFSWDIARDYYIRQYMYQFGLRYESKIYGMIPNYRNYSNIEFKGDYQVWHEFIGNVINWVKANTNIPVGLTVCQVRDDSDVRFHEAMKDLQYDFVYLWGLHDFTYDFGIEFGEANRWANGRPIILGGFWGDRINYGGELPELPEAILTDMSYKLPSFMAQRKSEGWKGFHIIGERWNVILSKCAARGIVLQ